MHMAEWKQKERKKYLELRNTLSESQRREKSQKICHTLCGLKEYELAKNIFCYVSFRSEVETSDLLEEILLDQKHLYVPKVFGRTMEFFEICSKEDLEAGAFGILEPVLQNGAAKKYPDDNSLVILPGVSFDLEGRRLGYGGGYYDRYLERYPRGMRIGLAYELQIADVLLQESLDIAIDAVITENRICRRSTKNN